MNTLPTPSTATPTGPFGWALVAAAPSPENPAVPVPAMVLMSPAAAIAVPPDTTVTTKTTTPTKPERRTCSTLSSVMPPVSRHHGGCDEPIPRNPLPRWTTENPDRTTPSGTPSAAPRPKVNPTDHAVS